MTELAHCGQGEKNTFSTEWSGKKTTFGTLWSVEKT